VNALDTIHAYRPQHAKQQPEWSRPGRGLKGPRKPGRAPVLSNGGTAIMTAPTTTTYPATSEGLTAALSALGATAEQVAHPLTVAGHTGQREDEATCPIAWSPRAVIPTAGDVYAGVRHPRGDRRLHAGLCLVDTTGWIDIEMSTGPAAFITAFDKGKFNSL